MSRQAARRTGGRAYNMGLEERCCTGKGFIRRCVQSARRSQLMVLLTCKWIELAMLVHSLLSAQDGSNQRMHGGVSRQGGARDGQTPKRTNREGFVGSEWLLVPGSRKSARRMLNARGTEVRCRDVCPR